MIAIPNTDKPQNITRCSYKIDPEECKCIYTDKVFEETLELILDHPCPDCPIIDIVTCGECKWWNEETHGCNRNPSVGAWWESDFCSYGERRT